MGKLINVVQDKFSVIPKDVFMDRRLDYRSKGILCTLLSLPNGWEFSIPGLVTLVTETDRGEKKDAVRAAIQYSERLGYLQRISCKDSKGQFAGYDYKINIPPIDMSD